MKLLFTLKFAKHKSVLMLGIPFFILILYVLEPNSKD